MPKNRIKRYIKSLRSFRLWHRYLGISLALLLLISAVTGIMLSWKKKFDVIQPSTQRGISKGLEHWKPIHELADIATTHFYETYPAQKDNPINRLDVRPSKGVVKVFYENEYWEVQVDGSSGKVLSVAQRNSDWIESIHDGSIISDLFKLISMNLLGVGLILLLSSGLWLWYGPGLIRKWKKRGGLNRN